IFAVKMLAHPRAGDADGVFAVASFFNVELALDQFFSRAIFGGQTRHGTEAIHLAADSESQRWISREVKDGKLEAGGAGVDDEDRAGIVSHGCIENRKGKNENCKVNGDPLVVN